MYESMTTEQAIYHYGRLLDALKKGLLPKTTYAGYRNRLEGSNEATDYMAYLSGCISVCNTGYTTITPELSDIMDQVHAAHVINQEYYQRALKIAREEVLTEFANKKIFERIRVDGKRRYVRIQ